MNEAQTGSKDELYTTFRVFIAPRTNPLAGEWTPAESAVSTWEAQQKRYGDVAFVDAEHPWVTENASPEFVETLALLDDDHNRLLSAYLHAGLCNPDRMDREGIEDPLRLVTLLLIIMREHQECISLLGSYFKQENMADFTIYRLNASIRVIIARIEDLRRSGYEVPKQTLLDSLYDFESTVKAVEAFRIREGKR
jgi:hypothetical protein